MFGLSLLDILVIAIYIIVLIIIGFWAMRRIHDQEDYFLGGRRFGRLIQVFAAFGQATSADTGPSVTTTTANNGAAGIWSALMMLLSTPSYWFTGVWYRRMRLLTMGDFFRERFSSRWLGAVYAFMASISLVLLLTVGFIGMTKTVMIMTPKEISEYTEAEKAEFERAMNLELLESIDYSVLSESQREEMETLRLEQPSKNFSHFNKYSLIIIIVIVVCIYSVAGGLEAAFLSDMMQGIFIILLSIILLPFAFIEINRRYGGEGIMGAFRILHEQLPQSYFEIFGSPHTIDFTWYYIIALAVMATINVAVGANQLVATGSAKNEYVARYGLTYGTYLKRITTVFWGLTALAAVLLFGSEVSDPDMLWGYASRELLAPLNLGLIGLMIAALMAALMSTADMMMITASGLITSSIYRPLNPGRSEKHYVLIGRFFGVLVVVGAALMVISSDSLFGRLKLLWEFGVIYSAGFWLGVLWRPTNRASVWASIVSTFTIFFLLPALLPLIFPGLRTHENLLQQTDERIETRTYTAHPGDVSIRLTEIAQWEELAASDQAAGPCPEPLEVGETFTREYKQPRKAIFWNLGISSGKDGYMEGKGILSLELVFLDAIGFDLSKNPFALNETLRIIFRTLFPFLVIVIISLIWRHEEDEIENLDKFYVKMKTPVQKFREDDEKELLLSYADPARFDHLKLFPRSQWQFTRWDRVDTIGFAISVAMVGFVLLLLFFLVNLGENIQFN